MPLPGRFERDVKNVVENSLDLDPGSIAARLDDMQSQVNGKAAINHTHSIAQVTGLPNALNDKADAAATQTALNSKADATDTQNALAQKANTSDVTTLLVNKADIKGNALQLPSCLSTSKPAAAPAGRLVYVSDTAIVAFSDGTDWRDVGTKAVI